MHEDELPFDLATATALIRSQLPEHGDEPIRPLPPGTVHAVYRVGERLTAHFPLRADDPQAVEARLRAEAEAMRELAAVCPVPTPLPVALGRPGHGYPLPWSVQTWAPGETATPTGAAASAPFARDLAALVRALRAAGTRGRRFVGTGRGGRLRDHDEWMDRCLAESQGLVEVTAVRELWRRLRELPRTAPDAMTHGDLIPQNLLVDGGRLAGVLDGGGFGPADPALDLVAAWHLLDADARRVLREELGSDDVEWARGAAWALEQAMGLVWYYRVSNPGMAALGRGTVGRILDARDTLRG